MLGLGPANKKNSDYIMGCTLWRINQSFSSRQRPPLAKKPSGQLLTHFPWCRLFEEEHRWHVSPSMVVLHAWQLDSWHLHFA